MHRVGDQPRLYYTVVSCWSFYKNHLHALIKNSHNKINKFTKVKITFLDTICHNSDMGKGKCKAKGHPCAGTEALYRLYGP